ncbi:hypothetical protein HDU76_009011 [Blyttiomyces sp. JEL0837]|nr:hypothetical protein HDU76_009011 [Blyttiomyces sp. JEL0837]
MAAHLPTIVLRSIDQLFRNNNNDFPPYNTALETRKQCSVVNRHWHSIFQAGLLERVIITDWERGWDAFADWVNGFDRKEDDKKEDGNDDQQEDGVVTEEREDFNSPKRIRYIQFGSYNHSRFPSMLLEPPNEIKASESEVYQTCTKLPNLCGFFGWSNVDDRTLTKTLIKIQLERKHQFTHILAPPEIPFSGQWRFMQMGDQLLSEVLPYVKMARYRSKINEVGLYLSKFVNLVHLHCSILDEDVSGFETLWNVLPTTLQSLHLRLEVSDEKEMFGKMPTDKRLLQLKHLHIQLANGISEDILVTALSRVLEHSCPNVESFGLELENSTEQPISDHNMLDRLYEQLDKLPSLTRFQLLTDESNDSDDTQTHISFVPRSWTFLRNTRHISINNIEILNMLIDQAPLVWWNNLETLFLMGINDTDINPLFQNSILDKGLLTSLKHIELAPPSDGDDDDPVAFVHQLMKSCPTLEYLGLNLLYENNRNYTAQCGDIAYKPWQFFFKESDRSKR